MRTEEMSPRLVGQGCPRAVWVMVERLGPKTLANESERFRPVDWRRRLW